jgi:hypothetical protein
VTLPVARVFVARSTRWRLLRASGPFDALAQRQLRRMACQEQASGRRMA